VDRASRATRSSILESRPSIFGIVSAAYFLACFKASGSVMFWSMKVGSSVSHEFQL
jgi:hypothetical protein